MEDKILAFIDAKKHEGFGHTTVVRLKQETINLNPAEKVFVLHKSVIDEEQNVYIFEFKVHYFNMDGDEITQELNSQKDNFIITPNMEIAERTFPDFEPVMVEVEDEEGNVTLEIKKSNAIKLLKNWAAEYPLPTLIEFYVYDRDEDGLFNRR